MPTGSEAQLDIQSITAAIFEHWDSRTGHPHLHTHVPISAKIKRASDGTWTTLDTRTIHASAVAMSEFYNSRLRDLFRDHGADWTEHPAESVDLKRPVWELAGVSDELLIGFSPRTQQVETDRAERIVAFRAEHGREPSPQRTPRDRPPRPVRHPRRQTSPAPWPTISGGGATGTSPSVVPSATTSSSPVEGRFSVAYPARSNNRAIGSVGSIQTSMSLTRATPTFPRDVMVQSAGLCGEAVAATIPDEASG